MDCPSCGVEMTDLAGDDTSVSKCSDCGGLWINVADLNRVLLHHNLPGLDSLSGKLKLDTLTGQCSECQVDLVSVEGGGRNHPLHYDTCESCGGIFLESEFKDAANIGAAFEEIVTFFRQFDVKARAKAAVVTR